jgi:hypothetical protein
MRHAEFLFLALLGLLRQGRFVHYWAVAVHGTNH